MSILKIKYSILQIFVVLFCFYPAFSQAIYNMKNNQSIDSKSVSKKYWILLDQSCAVCDAVMLELETICASGKKPSSKNLGFFVVAVNKDVVSKKLKSFKSGYDVYLGSSSQFYEAYGLQGSPSLLLKGSQKSIIGKTKIIKKLKKDTNFCKTS